MENRMHLMIFFLFRNEKRCTTAQKICVVSGDGVIAKNIVHIGMEMPNVFDRVPLNVGIALKEGLTNKRLMPNMFDRFPLNKGLAVK